MAQKKITGTRSEFRGQILNPEGIKVGDGTEYFELDFENMTANTEAQAIAGTVLTGRMPPLRVANAIEGYPFKRESTQAESLAAPRQFRKAGILLSQEVPSSDSDEAYTAIAAAIARLAAEGWGTPLRFDAPYNSSRTYRLLSRVNGGFTLPTNAEIIFDDRALLDFSAYGDITADSTSGATGRKIIFDTQGSLGTGRLLQSNASANQPTVVLQAGLGVNFSRGMDCIIASDDLFTTFDSVSTATVGERVIVESVSTDTVTLKGELHGSYTTAANAKLYPVTSVTLKVRNPRILGPGRPVGNFRGDRAFRALYGRDCEIEGGLIQRCDFAAIDFDAVLNGLISGVTVVQDGVGANTEVAFCFVLQDGCDSVTIQNCSTYGSSQPYDISASTGLGIARRLKLKSNRAKGAQSSAYSMHDSQELVTIEDNEADSCENGVDCRGGNVVIDNNRFKNLGTGLGNLGCGVQLRERAQNIQITRNYIDGCIRGVYLESADGTDGDPINIHICDNRILNVASGFYGIHLGWNENTNNLDDIVVCRNKIGLLGTAVGIRLGGTFRYPLVTDNEIAGGTSRSILLQAADASTAGQGPVSPIVRRNIIGTGNTVPLIQHDTGVRNVGDNYQRGVALFQTLATDEDFTLTPVTSPEFTRHTGVLGADRQVTLATSGVHANSRFRITRTGGGAFNLNVGTGPLKALATDTWCEVTFNGSAWFLSAYGAL
jgi:hypothetical protein